MTGAGTLSFLETYDACHVGAAGTVLECDVVRVTGRDARSYLQTQVSQDLDGLAPHASIEALLLSPQGRVDAYVRVALLGDEEILVAVAGGYGELVHDRLRRFRLRVKADLEQQRWRRVLLRGPKAAELAVGAADALVVPVAWPGVVGLDLLAPDAVLPAGVAAGDPLAFEAIRIEAGEPVMGREITDRTIAQEVGLVARAVSLTKGCYPGQELVARIDARGGNVPKRLRGVVARSVAGTAPGAPADQPVASPGAVLTVDGRTVGELTSVAWSPGLRATIALAYVRREIVPPAQLVLEVGDGASLPVEVVELPMAPAG